MTLVEWVSTHGRAAARHKLARALGLTEGAVRHWCNGIRRVPPIRCLDIEAATCGEVTREELRPDVFGEAKAKPKPRKKAA
jgi:DNA-binding transcriptional regulator YdaS (Cro superfamily)